MSFFDDDADATGQAPRGSTPRRGPVGARRVPRRAGSGASRSPGGSDDPQAVRRRQLILAAGVLLFLIVAVLGIKSCSDSARDRGLRDYERNLSAIVKDSDSRVSRPLFRLLSGAGGKQGDLPTQVNNLSVEANQELKQTEALDVPGEVTEGQRYALLTLELRRDGVTNIAEQIQPALRGQDGQQAVQRIAGEMRRFDASDVMWQSYVTPLVTRNLRSAGVDPNTEPLAGSKFLPDSGWLDPTFVADRLGAVSSGTGAGGSVAPGTHGHALDAVSVGATTLSESSPSSVPASPPPVFAVKVVNQGENDEMNVRVRVQVAGPGAPIIATKVIPRSAKGSTSTASVALPRAPSTGSVLKVTVSVLPVPGEKTKDNNTKTFSVLFTG